MQWYINDKGKEYMSLLCDKCGKPVAGHNSAINLEEQMGKFVGFSKDRHLYPIDNCPGSPSRVKLIESEPEWQQAYSAIKSFRVDMNLHKTPELVKQALIEMGDYPCENRASLEAGGAGVAEGAGGENPINEFRGFKPPAEGNSPPAPPASPALLSGDETESRNGSFPPSNSGHSLEDAVEWLSSREKDNADTFVIYGRMGVHRYIVTKNGEVFFSGLHGGDSVEKAVSLGFGIDN